MCSQVHCKTHTQTHMLKHMHAQARLCARVRTHAHTTRTRTNIHLHTDTYIRAHKHTCTNTQMLTTAQVCTCAIADTCWHAGANRLKHLSYSSPPEALQNEEPLHVQARPESSQGLEGVMTHNGFGGVSRPDSNPRRAAAAVHNLSCL